MNDSLTNLAWRSTAPLGVRMAGLAQSGIKPYGLHEVSIVMIPERMSIRITSVHNALHVVCENVFRNSKPFKSMHHSDKKILLLCIRKEFNITAVTMMTDHHKICSTLAACISDDINKSPVHLKAFAGFCLVPPSAITLRSNKFSLCRHKIQMCSNIALYLRATARIAFSAKAVSYGM